MRIPGLLIFKKFLYVLFKYFLYSLQKPRVIMAFNRGGVPLIWVVKRVLAEWQFVSCQVDIYEFVAFLTENKREEVECLRVNTKSINNLENAEFDERLYLITRFLQPQIVVETGVGSGRSTASILLALEHNSKGTLYSIDLPYNNETIKLEDGSLYVIPDGKPKGWMVPSYLRHRWQLTLGDARKELPLLLEKLGKIDLFIHDSLHTERHMMFEYETAWPFITNKGILLSHDISISFLRFSRKVNRPYQCFGPWYAKYGGIVR